MSTGGIGSHGGRARIGCWCHRLVRPHRIASDPRHPLHSRRTRTPTGGSRTRVGAHVPGRPATVQGHGPDVHADTRPIRRCALSLLRSERAPAPAALVRPLAELRGRDPSRDAASDAADRLRPRDQPLRSREQLWPTVRQCRDQLRTSAAEGLRILSRRADHLDQGRMGHVARTVRARRRFAEVHASEPRSEPASDGHRLRRHLLLTPLRSRYAARGDHGRTRDRGSAGQGVVRGPLVVLGEKDA